MGCFFGKANRNAAENVYVESGETQWRTELSVYCTDCSKLKIIYNYFNYKQFIKEQEMNVSSKAWV
ncbi:hypothetical protein NPIL_529071, partial [Nephila pilipes]